MPVLEDLTLSQNTTAHEIKLKKKKKKKAVGLGVVAFPFNSSDGGVTALVFKIYIESSRPARQWGHTPLIPASLEVEEGESLNLRPAGL